VAKTGAVKREEKNDRGAKETATRVHSKDSAAREEPDW